MKDTIILEGKNYISARRAAQISGYATDYIGQLCRDGKVLSLMVGRSWFVEENELKNYSRINSKKLPKNDLSQQPTPPPPVAQENQKSASDTLGELLKKVLQEHNHTQVQVQYQLPPPVRMRERDAEYREKEIKKITVPLKRIEKKLNEGIEKKFLASSTVAIASLILIIVSGIISLSLYKVPVVSESATAVPAISESNTAAVADAGTTSATKFIFESIWSSLAHIFGKSSAPEPQASPSGTPVSEGDQVDAGLVVAPSTNNPVKDEALRTRLQQTFSDEIKVTSDNLDGSGVLEPVFKKETKDSFIYVAVPIKQKQVEQ